MELTDLVSTTSTLRFWRIYLPEQWAGVRNICYISYLFWSGCKSLEFVSATFCPDNSMKDGMGDNDDDDEAPTAPWGLAIKAHAVVMLIFLVCPSNSHHGNYKHIWHACSLHQSLQLPLLLTSTLLTSHLHLPSALNMHGPRTHTITTIVSHNLATSPLWHQLPISASSLVSPISSTTTDEVIDDDPLKVLANFVKDLN